MENVNYECLTTYKCFEETDVKKEIDSFSQKKKVLTVAEVLLILLLQLKERSSESYFHLMWYASRLLIPVYGKEADAITDEDISLIMDSCSGNYKKFVNRWIRWIKEYDQKDGNLPSVSEKKISYLEFLERLSFPKDYHCGRNIQFGTLFKYWLFLNKDKFSNKYLTGFLLPSYRKFTPLHKVPFWRIRISDIYECIQNETQRNKDRELLVYKILDRFACELHIIPKRYACDIKIPKRPRTSTNVMSESQISLLKQHIGEIDTDITLTFIYTGIKLEEFMHLKEDDFQDGNLKVINQHRHYALRYIPVCDRILSCVLSSIHWMEGYHEKGYTKEHIRKTIEEKVKTSTYRYLNVSFTPEECRITFDNRLITHLVPRCAIDQLRGTRGCFSRTYEESYRHLSSDVLRGYVERCA